VRDANGHEHDLAFYGSIGSVAQFEEVWNCVTPGEPDSLGIRWSRRWCGLRGNIRNGGRELRMPLSGRGENDQTSGTPIMVETDLFEHREAKPHFINPCCFGEDFAAWLRQELSRVTELGLELSEPIQEDYGWGLWASRGNDRFWVALSFVGDGPQETPAKWVISVAHDPGLNVVKRLLHKPDPESLGRLQASVRQILAINPAIRTIKT
jgi:hypothetical protein